MHSDTVYLQLFLWWTVMQKLWARLAAHEINKNSRILYSLIMKYLYNFTIYEL